MKAIVLNAGQGKRLLPLTARDPKCLLPVDGRKPALGLQLESLARCGVERATVVVGFGARQVEQVLAASRVAGMAVDTLYNPFFALSDNLATCWLARHLMEEDFLLLNGDTLFRAPLLGQLLSSPEAPVTLAVDRKASYDEDDMKVRLDGTRLTDIGKTLPVDAVDAESIGCMVFRGEGPAIFARYLAAVLKDPENLRLWYLSVIRRMAQDGIEVRTALISGHPWCEVDYPLDLKRAQAMLSAWDEAEDSESDRAVLG